MKQAHRTTPAPVVDSPGKVLIVDDHPTLREGLTSCILRQPDLVVCGEAEGVVDALQLVEANRPDVVIVDISLRQGNGLDLIKRIKAHDSSIRMLACSMHPDSLYAERALLAGALGYVSKDNTTARILDAIRSVLLGNLYLSEDATRRLVQRSVGQRAKTGLAVESLSDRELEIFNLVSEGHSTREMAKQLHLSVHTVDTYRRRIRVKLGIKNAAELIRTATEWVVVDKRNVT